MALNPNIVPFQQPSEPLDIEVVPDSEGSSFDPQPEGIEPNPSHRDNLATYLEDGDLSEIASELLELYLSDLSSREEWIETYIKGLDYLGFSMEDREKPFKGASGVFHPVLSEAVVRFQSNAIMEIFPAAGPVMTKVVGDETPEKMQQAQRIKEELNYQLTEKMSEYRSEMEQLLFRLPLAGSVFKKVYYDPMKDRPCAHMVTAEDFVIDYYASDIDSAERYTHVMKRSPNEVRKMMRAGLYRKVNLQATTPQTSEGKEREDELMGMEPPLSKDERHTLLEFHVHYNLPEPFSDPNDIADPYIITIDKDSQEVLSIYRNWKPEDNQNRNKETYFVHYQYMPGLGFYGTGLIHLLGSIAKASTSILRQLLDAGTLSNLPGGLKTRGLRTAKGDDVPIQPGEWRDVDVPAGAIRDNLYPLPYQEPSATLVTLLQMLVDEGRRIGSIADVKIDSTSQNAPVGTTMALLERNLKVMTAVHARLHASLRRELKMIAEVITDYMGPHYEWDDTGHFDRKKDFDARVDVLPVSDPNAATQAQKIVQMQAVQQLAQMNPELYNMKELHRAALQAIGIKNDEKFLPVDQPPPRLDPVSENMHILTQQPIKVYMEQDHTAHIQAHLSWFTDPKTQELVGQSPNANVLQGAMEAHIAQHLAFQYRSEIEQLIGRPLPPPDKELPPEVEAALSRMVAQAAVKLRDRHDGEAQASLNDEMWKNPDYLIKLGELNLKNRELQHKIETDQTKIQVDIAKTADKEQLQLREMQGREAVEGAKVGANLVTFGAKLSAEERQSGVKLGKEVTDSIANYQQKDKEMWHEAFQRERDRLASLREAQLKKPVNNAG